VRKQIRPTGLASARTGGCLNNGGFVYAARPGGTQTRHIERKGMGTVIRGLVGLLIVIAVVLFIAKIAVVGGIVGAIALILLVLLVLKIL